MSGVRIHSISVSHDEDLHVKFNGSIEKSFSVRMLPDGRCFVTGPLNLHARTFELREEGMREVDKDSLTPLPT